MDTLAFIITTAALIVFVIVFSIYISNFINDNLISTDTYVYSLIDAALLHEFQTVVSLASLESVTGSFNYTISLPTASFATQGIAIQYNITIYIKETSTPTLIGNITITSRLGSISRTIRGSVPLYSAQEPFTMYAYNCEKSTGPVNLANSSCTWSSQDIVLGNAIIEVSK
ncbi:MAG: hypothetical protein RXR03_08910 [Thermocladium sp.]